MLSPSDADMLDKQCSRMNIGYRYGLNRKHRCNVKQKTDDLSLFIIGMCNNYRIFVQFLIHVQLSNDGKINELWIIIRMRYQSSVFSKDPFGRNEFFFKHFS